MSAPVVERPIPQLKPREATAERLLTASVEHSFDPLIAVDWSREPEPGLLYLPEHRMSLYGTPLWDRLTPEQRVELSKHEVASLLHIGIWFEVILMSLLSRHIYDEDARSKHVAYAWTELADECRHSTMFAMALEKLGTPSYAPSPKLHRLARTMHHLPPGPSAWAAILLGEELIDTLQREGMHDESIQPLMREIVRIHVIEEARHVRYAREELARQVEGISRSRLAVERTRIALSAYHVAHNFVHPRVYASVGLDVTEAREQAASNPHRQETLRWMAARLVEFLRSLDLIGGPSEVLWRRASLI
jgi:hypothetical protein